MVKKFKKIGRIEKGIINVASAGISLPNLVFRGVKNAKVEFKSAKKVLTNTAKRDTRTFKQMLKDFVPPK